MMHLTGMDKDAALAALGGEAAGTIRLPKSLEDATHLGIAVRGQWRLMSGLGGAHPIGLDYPALEAASRWLGIEITPPLFDQIAHIEAEALTIFAETK